MRHPTHGAPAFARSQPQHADGSSARGFLPQNVQHFLHRINPWWEGKPARPVPAYRRWAFGKILARLESQLAPVTVVRGPRQVGKSTLQNQIIDHLLSRGTSANRILHVQFDELPSLRGISEPILAIVEWFQHAILNCTFNEAARAGHPAYLFLDEIQNVDAWAPQLKSLVDHAELKVHVTGSSALRIESGRDSLAGRISTVELGTLLVREVAGLRSGETIAPYLPDNGLDALLERRFWEGIEPFSQQHADARRRGFGAFSERGGYPLAHSRPELAWHEVADQLNETVIRRAIQHDLRIGARGTRRDPQLLEEVFRLACRYAGQCPGQAILVHEIKDALRADVSWKRIRDYLGFLDGAMLLKLVPPLELRLKRSRGPARICLCDHGLRAAWLQETVPLDPKRLDASPHLRDLAGHIAESALGYFLGGLPHLDVAHFPPRGAEPEVDFVLTIGDQRIPVEVKYRRHIDPYRDTRGLRAFVEKSVYHAPFGILVTLDDGVSVDDRRIVPISLASLLFMR